MTFKLLLKIVLLLYLLLKIFNFSYYKNIDYKIYIWYYYKTIE